ncbi:MAG: NADPH-dependent FMN reductase, partial [Hyphomicrobiales bacterium]
MKILAISGSVRQGATNAALLKGIAEAAKSDCKIELFEGLVSLPIFSPDVDVADTPESVLEFATLVGKADGLIISSPEYVRAIPGGLKNAIDWLVPREELVNKPIALVHASHRGDDMLESMRLVLHTVTSSFDEKSFVRFPLMTKTPDEVHVFLK